MKEKQGTGSLYYNVSIQKPFHLLPNLIVMKQLQHKEKWRFSRNVRPQLCKKGIKQTGTYLMVPSNWALGLSDCQSHLCRHVTHHSILRFWQKWAHVDWSQGFLFRFLTEQTTQKADRERIVSGWEHSQPSKTKDDKKDESLSLNSKVSNCVLW